MKPKKPGRSVDRRGRTKGVDPFVYLPHWMLESEAYMALVPSERGLLTELLRRYNGSNNGRIALSVRDAGAALHIKPTTAGWAFEYLKEFGFVKVARDSSFGTNNKEAREFEITLHKVDGRLASKDFMRWDGRRRARAEIRPPKSKPKRRRKRKS